MVHDALLLQAGSQPLDLGFDSPRDVIGIAFVLLGDDNQHAGSTIYGRITEFRFGGFGHYRHITQPHRGAGGGDHHGFAQFGC